MPSFDVVSEVDEQEVDNGVNQAIKELAQRYDFKGTKCEIKWEKGEEIIIIGDDDYKLGAVNDILQSKLIKRNVSLKFLDYQTPEDGTGGIKRQTVKITKGISKEKAKEITKFIKETKLKVQAQIQGDQLRITGKKIDDLQDVIAELKGKDFGAALQFVNMRS